MHERTAARLRALCDANGSIYIKAAQVLSTSAALPGAYRAQLSALQDAAPPRPFAEVDAALRAELGASASALFASFDPVAAAAASLAQVHRATLADGRDVAVKVQYPGLAAAVAADMMTLRLIARLARGAGKRSDTDDADDASAAAAANDGNDDGDDGGMPDLTWVVAQLERNLARELDFISEGRNAERVAAAFAAFGGDAAVASAPGVVWERSSRRVLTMAWQDGCRVDDAEALRAAGLDTRDVARALVDAVGQMAFCFGALIVAEQLENPYIGMRSNAWPLAHSQALCMATCIRATSAWLLRRPRAAACLRACCAFRRPSRGRCWCCWTTGCTRS